MYGYRNPGFAPAYGAAGPAFPMARHHGYPITAFGAAPGFIDKTKTFLAAPGPLDVSTNGMWLGAAVLGAGVWWYVANH
jgi:hypothetical protein